jgi:hypothetical protein
MEIHLSISKIKNYFFNRKLFLFLFLKLYFTLALAYKSLSVISNAKRYPPTYSFQFYSGIFFPYLQISTANSIS